ncbi:hypothetical protein BCV69DRAFT_285510 [Microstroma glucosiphilum]|uniref:Hsp90 chaperone protein kinase-targeting subunit n=1 Tax=Pseudomicrostroma glucosiphilum TaxID=1684307 RepID=A0A316TYZ5_9BASI|nr:hypothetical protein BCV69DRAFT_285510 [Pseudomicrostroma glucosiphilum]PWN17918.1 hypothetical protein BCV69DRAFT_285510 [Pseudomicrostroma glucosiphilum]
MSRLNYSKWDNLELSDDSDVEVHPNVDKKSFIKWKQRDIHEKRETRKQELAAYRTELGFNDTLEPLLKEITDSTKSQGHQYFSREVSRLSAGRAERGNKDGPNGPTTDDMLLSLLLQINEEPSVKGKADTELDEALVAKLVDHQGRLKARTLQLKADIQRIEEEDKKKITSEGLKEGFNSSHVAKPEPEEAAPAPKKKTQSKKTTTSSIETLNAPSSSSAGPSSTSAAQAADSDAEDDEEEVPDLTPMTKAFGLLPPCIPSFLPLTLSQLPPNFTPKQLDGKPFSAALEFLSSHRLLLRDDSDTSDALLVEAFQSQMRGESKRARGFVEKGLMIQYLTKLGKDGVNLFFRRMASADGKAVTVFFNDVLSTYRRIADRCETLKKEEAEGVGAGEEKEQIQLVAEDPSTVITFEVPEGPPPENIQIEMPEGDEGEGDGEDGERPQVDIEQIRLFLQRRWDIFLSLEEEMQTALRTHNLGKVNAVLGNMKVQRAEEVVGLLDQGGILNFGSGGAEVRDETGK